VALGGRRPRLAGGQATDDATFESLRSDGSISGVTILKAGAGQSLGPVSGHTEIVIYYE
jgi:hypothetical protein